MYNLYSINVACGRRAVALWMGVLESHYQTLVHFHTMEIFAILCHPMTWYNRTENASINQHQTRTEQKLAMNIFRLMAIMALSELDFAECRSSARQRANAIRSQLCNARTCSKCVKTLDIFHLSSNMPYQRRCVVLLALNGCCANDRSRLSFRRRF